jgi:hypothetical protein
MKCVTRLRQFFYNNLAGAEAHQLEISLKNKTFQPNFSHLIPVLPMNMKGKELSIDFKNESL